MGQFCSKRFVPPEIDKSITLKQNQVPTIAYDQKTRRWIQVDANTLHGSLPSREKTSQKITAITWNVWFEHHLFKERTAELRRIIKTHKPDFICLQEVIPQFWMNLLNEDWVKERYYISGNAMRGYGLMILSTFPCNFYEFNFKSFMGRSLLVATGPINDTQWVTVATSHFESANSAPSRKAQLELTFEKLKDFSNPVLMGDFNFDNPEEKKNLSDEFVDVWEVLHSPEEPSHTMKPKAGLTPWRPDKVLALKSKNIVPRKIERIGTEPLAAYAKIEEANFITTPSDHYGLYSEFDIEQSS